MVDEYTLSIVAIVLFGLFAIRIVILILIDME